MPSSRDAATDPGRITRVGVVGAGQMGAGIAEVCARAHVDVLVWESTRELTTAGRARILQSLDRGVSSGKITEREREQAALRLRFTTDLDDFCDRQLVIEAVVEDEAAKSAVFRRLDEVVTDPGAVLATNTSAVRVATLGACTTRPQRVIGMHFFNPVPVLPLVELVSTPDTAADTRDRAEEFAHHVLGKQVVHSADRAGAVVNALLVPYLLSAIRMAESGHATAEDIDRAMVLGCAHPMGPLALADHVGLDTVKTVAEAMHAEFGEPLYAPPTLLVHLVESGRLGRRTGHGFHRYPVPRATARADR
ncbi:3-hydroxybutyryl-CoA dehydrogenase [Dietzia sp. CH92]|uniref:3-hydroxybutyryl-CoA dehydrogenase n=1 Tax=Dietzia sp. CH92 TaxID=3051823 RepID=UPI0028D136CE|nr:3-hydroxybutyryl-CoA dehydrogenase [Dietzia sp. CH92]